MRTRPKGSGQSIGKSSAVSPAEEIALLGLRDLADVLDVREGEERTDLTLEVLDVRGVHLGRDPQPLAGPPRDLDRPVHALLRRDPAQKRQVASVSAAGAEERRRKPVVDRPLPAGAGEVRLLGVRDRHDRHVVELAIHGREVGQIQPPVQGRHVRNSDAAREREVQVVDVKVDDVEVGGPTGAPSRAAGRGGPADPGRSGRAAAPGAMPGTSRAAVTESPLAKSVTAWPCATSSSVR